MKYITLEMTPYTDVIDEADFDDPWDKDDTITTWSFGEAELISNKKYGAFPVDDSFEDAHKVYLVVAIWSTGDSFHQATADSAEIFGAFTNREEAETEAERLRNATKDEKYLPWHGYFESLEEVRIVKRVL